MVLSLILLYPKPLWDLRHRVVKFAAKQCLYLDVCSCLAIDRCFLNFPGDSLSSEKKCPVLSTWEESRKSTWTI